jgi:hypothetical protein
MVLNGFLPCRPSLKDLLVPRDRTEPPMLLIPESGEPVLTPLLKRHGVDAVLPRPLTRSGFLTALVALQ